MTADQRFDPLQCPLTGVQLVEASAGTGKTWNICALVLRLLVEQRLPIDRILVVTFTNAAAAELRERIRSRIVELRDHLRDDAAADVLIVAIAARGRAGPAPETLGAHLDHALQSFDEAAVPTIHAFSQRALAGAPFTARIAPVLELLEDDGELRRGVVHDFWRRHVVAGSAALAAHLVAARDSPQRLDELLRRQLGQPLARQLWPADIDDAVPDPGAEIGAAHDAASARWVEARDAVIDLLHHALPALKGSIYKAKSVDAAVAAWDTLLASATPALAGADPDKAELLTATRLADGTKKNRVTPAHPFFAAAERLLAARAVQRNGLERQRLRLIRDLLREAPEALREARRERRVAAYDDLLWNLWTRLVAGPLPGLAPTLRARYPAMLIDEFQDTDALQFDIFMALHRGGGDGPLFLVGDPKQAIYRFRHADLHAYLAARAQADATHTLTDNQRSDPGLIDALNGLFGANPGAFVLPGLHHRAVAFGAKPRPAWLDASGGAGAPLTLWQLPRGDDGLPLHKAEAQQRAVAAAAAEIARLLSAAQRREVTIGGRPLAGGDIAVLVRTHQQGRAVRQALQALGVASVEHSQTSVWASAETEELERCLAAILAPSDAGLLRAALATSLMGFDATALLAFDADAAEADALLGRLVDYRNLWRDRGIGMMLRRWMVGEQVTARLLAEPAGERRLTNLLHLADLLHRQASDGASPELLLRHLQAARRDALGGSGGGDDAQLRLESDRHLVQIVTLHRSKGLEYGVVFCPLLWVGASLHRRSLPGVVAHDPEGTLVVDFGDDAATATRRADRAREDAAEAVRLLYVALTRAVHRCVLVVGSYTASRSDKVGGRAALNWLAGGAGTRFDDWMAAPRGADAVAQDWAELAARHARVIDLLRLPTAPGVGVAAPMLVPAQIVARRVLRPAPRGWRIGSFSALQHGAAADAPSADHDLRVVDAADAARPAVLEADDILRFPGGPVAGTCLHAVLERVDFGDAAAWPAVVDAVLAEQAAALGIDAAERPAHSRQVLRMLRDLLHTPLPVGTTRPLRLALLPGTRRIAELEFHFPVHGLDPAALQRVLASPGPPALRLAFAPLDGYLTGRIDLVCEHDGRVFVLDWKFNRLGDSAREYGAAPLAAAIAEHGYRLQALLYGVAVRRWLRACGRSDGDYGGALILFARGVRPDWPGAGVHFEPVDPVVLASLDALLGGARA